MNFIFMDLEYNYLRFGKNKFRISKHTGEPLMNELMQICTIVTNDKFDIISKLNIYVKPTLTQKINKTITDKTKLDEVKLNKIGIKLDSACDKLRLFLNKYNKKDSLLITWGGSDVGILNKNFEACGIKLKNELNNVDLQVVFANRNGFYDEYNVMEHVKLTNAGLMSGVSATYEDAHDAYVDTEITLGVAKSIGKDYIIDTKNQKRRKKAQNTKFSVDGCMVKYRPIVMGSNVFIRHLDETWHKVKLNDSCTQVISEIVCNEELACTITQMINEVRNIDEENGILKAF